MEIVFDTSRAFVEAFSMEGVAGREKDLIYSQIKTPLLERFREYVIKAYCEALGEVYYINSFRTNVVPLVNLQERVVAYYVDEYRLKVDLDEETIVFEDKMGDPVYRIKKGYGDEGPVENLNEYWRTPVRGVREDRYYTQEIIERVENYLSGAFHKMIRKQIAMNLPNKKGGAYGFKQQRT